MKEIQEAFYKWCEHDVAHDSYEQEALEVGFMGGWTARQPEVDALKARVVRLEFGLRNCRAYALMEHGDWGNHRMSHIVRFCENAGVKPSILRSDEENP